MLTGVKFCGMARECDKEAANELRPEYIGFVFWEKSKRYITPDEARHLKALLQGDIKAVGVFVDEDMNTIKGLSDKGIIDIIQLHGKEDDQYIHMLRRETGRQIIKAFRVHSDDDIDKANRSIADYVLLDAGMGQGRSFDWNLIERIHRPYFLAGGLNCDNIEDAVSRLNPFAVDVSSGIETEGKKDYAKMREFLSLVKGEELLRNV